jgi:hypothetical protein
LPYTVDKTVRLLDLQQGGLLALEFPSVITNWVNFIMGDADNKAKVYACSFGVGSVAATT